MHSIDSRKDVTNAPPGSAKCVPAAWVPPPLLSLALELAGGGDVDVEERWKPLGDKGTSGT